MRQGENDVTPPAARRRALAPHWGALAALALFLIAGLAVLDDYGVTVDEHIQRGIAEGNRDYLAGSADGLPSYNNSFYGVAFELPLLLAERVFDLEDGRGVWLARRLATHLLFLTGGLFAYLLAHRLTGSRFLAILAMLLFLLHPRLYAHSFFNTKDIPFLVALMITLFLAHRAFKRGDLSSFVLLGISVGALANLRIMGLILFPAVIAMRWLDFGFAQGFVNRKRIAVASGAFALAGALTTYVLLPYLWSAPAGSLIDWWTSSSDHPRTPIELFRGTLHRSVDMPPDYLSTWIAITTPPFALLLGAVGLASIFVRGIKARGEVFRNTRLRFGVMLAGCFALPIFAVILFDLNIYNGWRQMHFLWAPFSLLAALGLHWLTTLIKKARLRGAAYGTAGASVAATIVSMALLHPNQQVAFNFFVDRVEPERLRTQYVMDYWGHPTLQAVNSLLENNAFVEVNAHSLSEERNLLARQNIAFLPEQRRDRISISVGLDALVIADGSAYLHFINPSEGFPPPNRLERRIQAYANTIMHVERKRDLRAIYAETAAQEPVIRSAFDVYITDDSVAYVKEPCSDSDPALSYGTDFYLQFIPANREELVTNDEKKKGFEEVRFRLPGYGALFDGKCVSAAPLPPYRVAAIRTNERSGRDVLWEGESRFDSEAYRDLYARLAVEEPLLRSDFDLYVADGALTYIKEPCGSPESGYPFFLHVIPERASDLPEEERERGFANMDFELLLLRGAVFDGKCVASVPLPEYPIAGIRTGQRARDEWEGGSGRLLSRGGEIWRAEFPLRVEPLSSDGERGGAA